MCEKVVWIASSYLTKVEHRMTFGKRSIWLYDFYVMIFVYWELIYICLICEDLFEDGSYTCLLRFYQNRMKIIH